MKNQRHFDPTATGRAMLKALQSREPEQVKPIVMAMLFALARYGKINDQDAAAIGAMNTLAQALADPFHESLDDLRADPAEAAHARAERAA